MRAPGRLLQRATIVAVLVVPVIVFFVLQAKISETRSGSIDEVWFVDAADGPRLVARDQIAVGSERSVKIRHRLALVDLANGERLARRKVDAALSLAGVTDAGLWFWRKGDQGDLHLRSSRTLERLNARSSPPPDPVPTPASAPVTTSAATLPDGRSLVSTPSRIIDASGVIVAGGDLREPSFLVDARTGAPLLLADPPSALLVSGGGENFHLLRIASNGATLWRVPMERQRAIRAASRVGEVVVVITSGVARDFALAIDLQTGATRWVHHF